MSADEDTPVVAEKMFSEETLKARIKAALESLEEAKKEEAAPTILKSSGTDDLIEKLEKMIKDLETEGGSRSRKHKGKGKHGATRKRRHGKKY